MREIQQNPSGKNIVILYLLERAETEIESESGRDRARKERLVVIMVINYQKDGKPVKMLMCKMFHKNWCYFSLCVFLCVAVVLDHRVCGYMDIHRAREPSHSHQKPESINRTSTTKLKN